MIVAIFAVVLLLFGGMFAAVIWGAMWLNKSKSPRAEEFRRLMGGRAKQRDDGSKSFHWAGEARALRRAAAAEYAAKNGFTYAERDASLLQRLRGSRAVFVDDKGDFEDVLRRDNITIASYTWRTSEETTTQTLLFFDAALPPFYATTETVAHKAGLLGPDIDFAEDSRFSEMFHLSSADERAARRLFGREVRAEFVRIGHCRVESNGAALMFVEQEQTTVRGYEMFVDESLRLANKLLTNRS